MCQIHKALCDDIYLRSSNRDTKFFNFLKTSCNVKLEMQLFKVSIKLWSRPSPELQKVTRVLGWRNKTPLTFIFFNVEFINFLVSQNTKTYKFPDVMISMTIWWPFILINSSANVTSDDRNDSWRRALFLSSSLCPHRDFFMTCDVCA